MLVNYDSLVPVPIPSKLRSPPIYSSNIDINLHSDTCIFSPFVLHLTPVRPGDCGNAIVSSCLVLTVTPLTFSTSSRTLVSSIADLTRHSLLLTQQCHPAPLLARLYLNNILLPLHPITSNRHQLLVLTHPPSVATVVVAGLRPQRVRYPNHVGVSPYAKAISKRPSHV